MNFKRTLTLLALSSPLIAPAQNHCLGINFTGEVYKVNISTGAGTLVGSSGLTGTNCMARANDEWYTVDITGKLFRIDENSGAPTLVYQLSLGGNTDVRGMCYDVNLGNFVVVNNTAGDQLWKVNASDGVGSLIGNMGSTTIQGLAVGFNGKLYAYDIASTNSGGLREVNPNTGATIDINPNAPGQSGMQDICPDGARLLGGRDSLFRVQTFNGAEELVGTGGYSDLRGMARRQNTLEANALNVRLGRLDAGGLDTIIRRDGANAVISKFFVPNQQVDPIQVEMTFDASVSASTIRDIGIYWVGKMNTSGSFSLNIDIFNRTTNSYVTLATGPVTIAESELSGSLPGDLTPYFDAETRATVRFRIKANGPVANPSWGVLVDMFRMELIADF